MPDGYRMVDNADPTLPPLKQITGESEVCLGCARRRDPTHPDVVRHLNFAKRETKAADAEATRVAMAPLVKAAVTEVLRPDASKFTP